MATFDEVRDSLDALEELRKRAESLVGQIDALKDQQARLDADLAQIKPAVVQAETDFRAKAASLDISKDGA